MSSSFVIVFFQLNYTISFHIMSYSVMQYHTRAFHSILYCIIVFSLRTCEIDSLPVGNMSGGIFLAGCYVGNAMQILCCRGRDYFLHQNQVCLDNTRYNWNLIRPQEWKWKEYKTRQFFFLLTSCSNPLPLDSWQVLYESHGGSRISWFALEEF